MKKTKRRGFTIVELVIVIAVIGILSAILIPTFIGLIHKANVASDTALARNLNAVLTADEVENGTPHDMEEVLISLDKGGYKLENLNPRADGNVFVWDESTNQILYIDTEGKVLFNSKNYDENNKGAWWLTVKTAKDTTDYSEFSYYLVQDVSETITLTGNSSLDTGAKTASNVTVESITNEITINGNITGTLTVNSATGTVNNYSVVDTVEIKQTANESYHEYGYVTGTFKVTATSGKVAFEKGSYVAKITEVSEGVNYTQETGSYIEKVEVSTTKVEETTSEEYVLEIGNYDELCRFRDKVNNGAKFVGATVKLTANIDLSSRAWTPIGANARKNGGIDLTNTASVFQGTFDGQGHTISGLNNTGFSISSNFGGKNNSTPANCTEFVFGLFGTTYNATIKNLTMSNVDIDLAYQANSDKDGYVLGDSVGAVVGCLLGDANSDITSTVEHCKVTSGTINGYDATGGVIGRIGNCKVKVTDCSNAATITAIRRAGGVIGVDASRQTRTFDTLTNSGNVTSLGQEYDDPGRIEEVKDKGDKAGYYSQNYFLAGGVMTAVSNITEENFKNCTSTGKVEAQKITHLKSNGTAIKDTYDPSGDIAITQKQIYKNNKWEDNVA